MADYSRDYQISYAEDESSCTIRFRCFDTPNAVTVHGASSKGVNPEHALLLVRDECLKLHRIWSFSLPESDVSRVNAAAGGLGVKVSLQTASLIGRMKRFHELEPCFDYTIGPLSYLWKHARAVPSEQAIGRARALVGAEKVTVTRSEADDGQPGDCFVSKDDAGVQVDVGGAAKGFAADSVADLLRAFGYASAEIDLGGNLYMVGSHPEGRPWRVAVRPPQGVEAERVVVQVVDRSVVTSGSYERFVEIDGKCYQHIVDPTTGYPSESDIVSATVVHESSLVADMMATTALLAGSTGLDALAVRHPECAIVAITADGTVLRPGPGEL